VVVAFLRHADTRCIIQTPANPLGAREAQQLENWDTVADSRNTNANLIRVDNDALLEWLQENNSSPNRDRIKDHPCLNCGHPHTGLGGLMQSDGRIAVKVYCASCHEAISGALRVPPILRDAIDIIVRKHHIPCEVTDCTSEYSQTHHVFPTSIDWDLGVIYPTVQLCEHHHSLWHQMTRIAVGGTMR
jgi:hypothetical protein